MPTSPDVRFLPSYPEVGYLEDGDPLTRSPEGILTAGSKGPTFGLSDYLLGGESSDELFQFYPYGLLAHELSLGPVEFSFTVAPRAWPPPLLHFYTDPVQMVALPEPGAAMIWPAALVATTVLARRSGQRPDGSKQRPHAPRI